MEFKIVTLTSNNRVVYHLNNILGFNDVLLQGQPVIDPVSGTTSSCWDSLKFSKLFCKSQNQLPYNIIRYDKNLLLNDDKPSIGLLRSVIINSGGKVVSFAPPKSIDWLIFSKLYP